MNKTWLQETKDIITDSAKETGPYEIDVLDKKLIIYPEVFSPKYFSDAVYFAEVIPQIVGNKTFCEVGVGSGVVSLFTALNGAKNIAGTDINPCAIQNTAENFKHHGLTIDLYEGNVLDPVPSEKRFDFIFWNHPFNSVGFDVEDMLSRAVFDRQFEGLKHYFQKAKAYLTENGTLLLGSGDLANQEEVMEIARQSGWKLISTRNRDSKVRVGGDRPMRLFVYEFHHE